MSALRHPLRILAAIVALGGLAGPGRSAGFESLLRSSPFGRPGTAAEAPLAPLLEFRGVWVDGDREYFSIHETKSRRSMWVGRNEPDNPYVIRGYDAARGILTVEYQGAILDLLLKNAVILETARTDAGSAAAAAGPAVLTGVAGGYRIGHVADAIRLRRLAPPSPGGPGN